MLKCPQCGYEPPSVKAEQGTPYPSMPHHKDDKYHDDACKCFYCAVRMEAKEAVTKHAEK